ncbi:MAG: VCBS repeat-containing protein [Cyclobacteriaceae bacterium]
MRTHSIVVYLTLLASLAACSSPPRASFEKITLTKDFLSEGVAAADVNKDGKPDVLAGTVWFEAPDWKQHAIDTIKVYNPATEYSHSFINAASDVNGDGWVDLLLVDFPGEEARWYENPGKSEGYWKRHLIYPHVANESPAFVDIDGDGIHDLLCADPADGQMIWLKRPNHPDSSTWKKFTISKPNSPGTDIFSHGLGYGDMNGDGRPDVIITQGWWEAPVNPQQPDWSFHPADLGDPCSQMYAMDVNGDGLQDVISCSAHLAGIWWHEQIRDSTGTHWEHHVLSYAFAESHAVIMQDINGDKAPDFATGKRNLQRNTWRKNPGTHGPPRLYWFEHTKGIDPFWKPHLIDTTVGAGLNLVAIDMNQDSQRDLIVSNFKGVYIFINRLSIPATQD